MKYEEMNYDLVIVGAGPAGLSAAIRLKQLDKKYNTNHSVCIIEKGAEVGSHIISGAILEPTSLNELIPNWQDTDIPVTTKVEKESFHFFSKRNSIKIPSLFLPKDMKNDGNYIISLGNLCKWLGVYAEKLGVDIFPGFSAQKIIYDEDGAVKGVLSGAKGILKTAEKSNQYEPPIALISKQTFFAEGCRGHLGKEIIKKYKLYSHDYKFQTYAIGIKELWEVDDSRFKKGSVLHSIGWPLKNNAYGGSFLYKLSNNLASVGFVIGLDYKNPYLNPYEEFQKFKTHSKIKRILSSGNRISYGARALNEGGFQSLPQMSFPGGLLIGCEAGTLNVLKIKGTHTAMKSGMLASEIFHQVNLKGKQKKHLIEYENAFKRSSIYKELYRVRNVRPGFKKGLLPGLLNTFIDQKIFRGKTLWTIKHEVKDHKSTDKKTNCKPIYYKKSDNILTFDKLTNLSFSGTNHKEDQPCHLLLKDSRIPIEVNKKFFDSPETRYCPANVYEIVEQKFTLKNGETEKKYELQINFQNCLHCKTCDIKDPNQNINWISPEGGDGPRYSNM